MKVNIDTKEKFTVITPTELEINANMAESFEQVCQQVLNSNTPNLVLNLHQVTAVNEVIANAIIQQQQSFYEKNSSFVVCNLQPSVETFFDDLELTDLLNVTPTESEAWDIVQMEEIERELMDGEDVEFDVTD